MKSSKMSQGTNASKWLGNTALK